MKRSRRAIAFDSLSASFSADDVEAVHASPPSQIAFHEDGRVYCIEFTATDGSTHEGCSGFVTLFVPHDKKKPVHAVDDGQAYDSTEE